MKGFDLNLDSLPMQTVIKTDEMCVSVEHILSYRFLELYLL